jgi:glycine C-acetyltransferase
LNGTTAIHRLLEKRLAEFKGSEECMVFSSGFGANYGMISALVGKQDALIADSLAHASIIDGARTCRGELYHFEHNNVDSLVETIKNAEADGKLNKFIIIEGVYSMDGDIPPLDRIFETAKKHNCLLMIDDAHGTGIMGKHGKGIAERFGLEGRIDMIMGTFSKAFASAGGFIAASSDLIGYMRFFARSYFFSAAPPPMLIAQVLSSLDIITEHPELIEMLYSNVDYILNGLNSIGYKCNTDSAIITIPVPEGIHIRKTARQFNDAGVFINHIEYPAVPLDKQRFRISAMSTHTKEDMDKLINAFDTIGRAAGLLG